MNHLNNNNNNNKVRSIGVSPQLANLKILLNASGCIESGFQTLKIDKKYGKGTIKNVDFNNGMSVTQYDLLLSDTFTFPLYNDSQDYIYFFYGEEGVCYHNFKGEEKYTQIEEFSTSIFGANKDCTSEITLKKNKRFVYAVISINKEQYFEELERKFNTPLTNISALKEVFNSLPTYVYQCTCNLEINKQLSLLKLSRTNFQISNMLFFESQFQIILSMQIEQLYNEIHHERVITNLSKLELKKVQQLTDYIIESPMLNHTIKDLCAKVILSPSKLQEGFKLIHNTTVSNFIKNTRIEESHDLLLNSDYNISEIAYKVGFTSRSYFCKIFKEKYGCNAILYRNKYKDNSVNLNDLNNG